MSAITPETKVSMTLVKWVSGLIAVAGLSWGARGYMEEDLRYKEQIMIRLAAIESNQNDTVSQRQFVLFADNMRYENKLKNYEVVIPDPKQFAR